MSVNPPPKKIDEDDIHSIANKGAPAMPEPDEEKGFKVISLRMPSKFLSKVDVARKKQVGLTRNAWILQALQRALEE